MVGDFARLILTHGSCLRASIVVAHSERVQGAVERVCAEDGQ